MKPTICLSMIVKNEAPVIIRCLDSIKDYIDCWCICDTGSTDGTQKVIKDYLKDIPGELLEHEWIDFSTNRNKSVEIAKTKADYVITIDADDIFVIKDKDIFNNLTEMNYAILTHHLNLYYQKMQLISSKSDAHYEYVLHEVLVSKHPMKLLQGITMEILGGGDRNKNLKKFLEDSVILQKEVDKNPTNARYVFYLAQSYRDSGDYKKAIYYYKQRVLLGGWEEEVYYSQYQIGRCAEYLKQYNEAILNYLIAFDLRPTRSEPLYRLAVIYRQLGKYNLGYLFAKKGLEISIPTDVLFVENEIYNYLLLFELSIHEYWIGKYEDAIISCKKLSQIQNVPDDVFNLNIKNIQFSYKKLRNK